MKDMEKEEKYILDKVGRKTPFAVPDDYFDDFATQLMQSLPEPESTDKARVVALKPMALRRFRPVAIAAASLIAAIFSLGIYLQGSKPQVAESQATASAGAAVGASYTAVDAMADYAMLDTEDMYAYMQESEY